MVHGLPLATVVCRRFGKTPFVQVCTARVLACLVKQRPRRTSQIKIRLLDTRVSSSGDQISQWSVVVWLSGIVLASINEVKRPGARLIIYLHFSKPKCH